MSQTEEDGEIGNFNKVIFRARLGDDEKAYYTDPTGCKRNVLFHWNEIIISI